MTLHLPDTSFSLKTLRHRIIAEVGISPFDCRLSFGWHIMIVDES